MISEEVPKELVQQVRGTTLLAEVLVGLKRLTLPDLDLGQSKQLPGAVTEALIQGELG